MKTTYRKSWPANQFQVPDLTFDPKVKWDHHTKKALHFPLNIPPLWLQKMKTTCKKSWSVNLLQVSNLTFDPCFKVKWGNHPKRPYFSLIMSPSASKCENNL